MRKLLLAATLAGCAAQSSTHRTTGSAADLHGATSDPASRPAAAARAIGDNGGGAPRTVETPGKIARSALMPTLDASPGYFLQNVQTEPRLMGGRFIGWRLISFFPGDTRFAGLDLQAGDVVTAVNGRSLEKPEQLMDLWTELRSAKELVVELDRRGQARRLRWIITDK